MKKNLLQEVIDSLIKEELKRHHKKSLKEFAGNELQNAISAFAQNSATGTPASLRRAGILRNLIQTSAQQNPSIINQIPVNLRSALGFAAPEAAAAAPTAGTGLATAGGVGGGGVGAGVGGGGGAASSGLATTGGSGLATTGGSGLATTGAAETAALGAGAGETAALGAGAGEAAAAGAGAAGTAGTGLGLSSVLPVAGAGAAGYVGGRLANAGIGAGLRAAGADVSQGAENASGWGDLSLGSWLGGLAGQGVQQGQRTNQRGIQSSAESQINPANQMGEIGEAINKANADMQQFRQEFERQTAEIRRQMQSLTANTATPKAAVSTPRSSTSTTGTK